jgi:hypothetical protein
VHRDLTLSSETVDDCRTDVALEVRGRTNNRDVVALGLAKRCVSCVTEQIELS